MRYRIARRPFVSALPPHRGAASTCGDARPAASIVPDSRRCSGAGVLSSAPCRLVPLKQDTRTHRPAHRGEKQITHGEAEERGRTEARLMAAFGGRIGPRRGPPSATRATRGHSTRTPPFVPVTPLPRGEAVCSVLSVSARNHRTHAAGTMRG